MGSVILEEGFGIHPRRRTKIVVATLYAVAFAAYVIIGFQPNQSSAAEEIALAEKANTLSGQLVINSISLSTPVKSVQLENRTLNVPDNIVGSFSENENKTFLFGHSSTIFEHLKDVKLGDAIDYKDHSYKVTNIETRKKSEISMKNILESEETDTLVLMTCSGESLGDNDYSHRLIITAEAV